MSRPPTLPPTRPIAGLDVARLDELRDLDPGSTAYLDRAIGNFARASHAAPAAFAAHVAADDAVGLRHAAHRLLGSALNLGARVAVDSLRALEEVGDSGEVREGLHLLPAVEGALERARVLLAAYQRTYAEPRAEAAADRDGL